jgi:LPXTG-motif cell wall-anchored protein
MYDTNSNTLAATGMSLPTILGAVLAPQLFFQILGLSAIAIGGLWMFFKRRNA